MPICFLFIYISIRQLTFLRYRRHEGTLLARYVTVEKSKWQSANNEQRTSCFIPNENVTFYRAVHGRSPFVFHFISALQARLDVFLFRNEKRIRYRAGGKRTKLNKLQTTRAAHLYYFLRARETVYKLRAVNYLPYSRLTAGISGIIQIVS